MDTSRISLSKISPSFLHANATSHTWIFSAFAELIDNAYDPDCGATILLINYRKIGETDSITFTDDGHGLSPDKLHLMLSFGYCDKVAVSNHVPIGQYGNGFKSGSMRIGKDALVLTKHDSLISCGFLSQTFLHDSKSDSIRVPIISFDAKEKLISEAMRDSLAVILKYSPFKNEGQLLEEAKNIISFGSGTHIIIFNLSIVDGRSELYVTDDDLLNIETQSVDTNNMIRPVADDQPFRKSLREYCSVLFLKPKMKIFIRDSKVKTKLISKSLSQTVKETYKPMWQKKPVVITLGFSNPKNDYGLLLYSKNRLITAFTKIGYQKQANELGVGVIAVAEVNFLQPIHNKQEFLKTDKYNSCMSALAQKLNSYWDVKFQNKQQEPTMKPDWTWIQCDSCLKWRRQPESVAGFDLPDRWFCFNNLDPLHNRCEIPEEPEDEDLIFSSNYKLEKSVLLRRRHEKMARRISKDDILQRKRKRDLEEKLMMSQSRERQHKRVIRNLHAQKDVLTQQTMVTSSHLSKIMDCLPLETSPEQISKQFVTSKESESTKEPSSAEEPSPTKESASSVKGSPVTTVAKISGIECHCCVATRKKLKDLRKSCCSLINILLPNVYPSLSGESENIARIVDDIVDSYTQTQDSPGTTETAPDKINSSTEINRTEDSEDMKTEEIKGEKEDIKVDVRIEVGAEKYSQTIENCDVIVLDED